MKGNGFLIGDDGGLVGDGELESEEPLGKNGGGLDGLYDELLAGRGPVQVKYVVNMAVVCGASGFVYWEVFGIQFLKGWEGGTGD